MGSSEVLIWVVLQFCTYSTCDFCLRLVPLCSCSFPQWISTILQSPISGSLHCNLGFIFPAPCNGFFGSFSRESNNYTQCLDSRAFCSLGASFHESLPLASSMPWNDTAGTAPHGSHHGYSSTTWLPQKPWTGMQVLIEGGNCFSLGYMGWLSCTSMSTDKEIIIP